MIGDYQLNFNDLRTYESKSKESLVSIESRGINDKKKYLSIYESVNSILNKAEHHTEKQKHNAETVLKFEVSRFLNHNLYSALGSFSESLLSEPLGKFLGEEDLSSFCIFSPNKLANIVTHESTLSSENVFLINSIYTYFRLLRPRDLLNKYVVEKVTVKAHSDVATQLLLVAARWAALTRLILEGAMNDHALYEAEICLEKARSFSDAFWRIQNKKLELLSTRRNDGLDIVEIAMNRMADNYSDVSPTQVYENLKNNPVTHMGLTTNHVSNSHGDWIVLGDKKFSKSSIRQRAGRAKKKKGAY